MPDAVVGGTGEAAWSDVNSLYGGGMQFTIGTWNRAAALSRGRLPTVNSHAAIAALSPAAQVFAAWLIVRQDGGSWQKRLRSFDGWALSTSAAALRDVLPLCPPDVRVLAWVKHTHLYLWTINAYVEDAYEIARHWGFRPSTLLTWCKTPNGLGLGGTYSLTTEYVLFARRGVCPASERIDSTWWHWARGPHSAKPEAFLDMVERVSPSPRLEMFARRQRLGWDTWGNEALNHVELAGARAAVEGHNTESADEA